MIQIDVNAQDGQIPKPIVGSPARLGGKLYTVLSVSRGGAVIVLKRDADGKEVKCRRARVGRLPRELCKADVTPCYYDARGRIVS